MSSSSSTSPNSDELDGSDSTLAFGPDPAITGPNLGSTGAQKQQEVTKPIRFGSLVKSSASAPQDTLDWALVKIEGADIIQSTSQSFSNLMINKVCLANNLCIYPESLRGSRGCRVLVCLGSHKTAVEGTLSEVPSFSKTPGYNVFQELWQVKRFDGIFGKFRS